MKLKEIVGLNLKYYRYKSGKSQEQFYEELHLNPKYYASVERGEKNITSDSIDTIASKLNLDSSDLVNYTYNHNIVKKRIDAKEEESAIKS